MTPREIAAAFTALGVRLWVCPDGTIKYRRSDKYRLPEHLRELPAAEYYSLADHLRVEPQCWWFGRGPWKRWHIATVTSGDVLWSLCNATPLTGRDLSREIPPHSEHDQLCRNCIRSWVERQLRQMISAKARAS